MRYEFITVTSDAPLQSNELGWYGYIKWQLVQVLVIPEGKFHYIFQRPLP